MPQRTANGKRARGIELTSREFMLAYGRRCRRAMRDMGVSIRSLGRAFSRSVVAAQRFERAASTSKFGKAILIGDATLHVCPKCDAAIGVFCNVDGFKFSVHSERVKVLVDAS